MYSFIGVLRLKMLMLAAKNVVQSCVGEVTTMFNHKTSLSRACIFLANPCFVIETN